MILKTNPNNNSNITRVRSLYGIGDTLARRIIANLGMGVEDIALRAIANNPYCLMHIEGIGFAKADKIALGDYRLNPDDFRRHEGANTHILEQNGPLTWSEFRRARSKMNPPLYDRAHESDGVVEDGGRVWLPVELDAERFLASWMSTLYRSSREWRDWRCPNGEITGLDATQARAALFALYNPWRVMTLTGDAGTGKTHVIAAIGKLAAQRGLSMHVMAFAGKAADRAREALARAGSPGAASTIHRALGIGKGGTLYGANGELGADIIVLDEASMVPNWLFAAIIANLKPDARLVIVGDEAQLPPIGYGTPFNDLLALKLPGVRLEKNYRQRDQQGILNLARAMRERTNLPNDTQLTGVRLECQPDLDAFNAALTAKLGAYTLEEWDAWQAVTFKNDVREQINAGVQSAINPNGKMLLTVRAYHLEDQSHLEIRTGDKVLITRNDYDLDVFNGQLGLALGVEEMPPANTDELLPKPVYHLVLEMRGGKRYLPLDVAGELLTLGYCITCHKAQGSGWRDVIVVQPEPVHGQAHPNRWHYTAVTRAETSLEVFTLMRRGDLWENATKRTAVQDSSLFNRVRELVAQPSSQRARVDA